jgi:phosphate-selective porin OprO and OprP
VRNVITLFCLMFALGAVAEPLTVKPGKGIQLTTEDEEFQLNVRPRAQFLYIFDTDFDVEPEALPDASHSLQLRRARLAMTGHMFGPRHYFKMELAFSPRDLGMKDGVPTQTPLLDLYSEFRYFRDINLRVGQYKVPFSRQRVISSGNLQMVDRTLANGEFNLDRDVGADLRSKNLFGWDLFRYYVGVYAGEGRDAFQPIEWNTDLHFMSLARAEFVPHGECDDYTESDFVEDRRRPCLSLGLAHAFLYRAQNNKGIKGSVPEDGGTTSMDVTTMDLMAKWYGLVFFP